MSGGLERHPAPDGDCYSWWHEPWPDIVVVRRDRDDVRLIWSKLRQVPNPAHAEVWIGFAAGYLQGLEKRFGSSLKPGSVVALDHAGRLLDILVRDHVVI